jgi:hypothetical protein
MIWLGFGRWRVFRRGECSDCKPLNLRDKPLARQWLQQFRNDNSSMASLRGLLIENSDTWPIGGMKEEAVIDQIANELSCGTLQVCPETLHQGSSRSEASATPEPAPFPLSERRLRASTVPANPPMSEPPTFSSDVDLAAQAATLVAAAAEGKPFCPE